MFDKDVGVIVGDSAVFQLKIAVPQGAINFDVVLTGATGEFYRLPQWFPNLSGSRTTENILVLREAQLIDLY
jgi:hypothetical protein